MTHPSHSNPQLRIGVFLCLAEGHVSQILPPLRRAAEELNLRFLLHGLPSSGSFDQVASRYRLEDLGFDSAPLDGLLAFFPPAPLIERLENFQRDGLPGLIVMRQSPTVPHLILDDDPAIQALVRRLHRHGHRRIAFIRGPDTNLSAKRRFSGYRLGLESIGQSLDEELILNGDFTEERACQSVLSALARNAGFTALIAANDMTAQGALRALATRGVRVPADVEVVGFDNLVSTMLTDPPLTTFQLPVEAMARLAVEQMASLCRGGQVPLTTRFFPRLIVRGSTRFTDHDPVLDETPSHCATASVPPGIFADLRRSVSSGRPWDKVLASAEHALCQGARQDLDIDALTAAIGEELSAATPHGLDESSDNRRRLLDAALALTRAAVRINVAREAERAQTFEQRTLRLRELPFENLKEAEIIVVLKKTLAGLGFGHSRLFLETATTHGKKSDIGTLHIWDLLADLAKETHAIRGDVLRATLELSLRSRLTFVMPLIVQDAIIGHLVCDGLSRFDDKLGFFARHAASAIHDARLHRDLWQSNESLRETQRELIEVSRLAGVAEVATGVLHNIGNALNSVNTSAGVVGDELLKLRIPSIGKIGKLLVGDAEPWSVQFTQTERGQKAVLFVQALEEYFERARSGLLREVHALREGVAHVNQIVAAQQAFAQIAGIAEDQDASASAEYALRLCEAELLRHRIAVVRDYQPAPPVRIERHKAVQIIVNLIRNAKEALAHCQRPDPRIQVGVRPGPAGTVHCYVSDNGIGIGAENLPRIFSMGFTTKKGGHGFGLHNCALTAATLGGSLQVESEGPGRGATFILNLPVATESAA